MHILQRMQAMAMVGRQWLSLRRRYENRPLDGLLAELTLSPRTYAKSWSEAEAVRAASAWLVARLPQCSMGNCLKLALLRYPVLRSRGFNVRFHLGLAYRDGQLEGHAWLTLNGQPLWEAPETLGRFRETFVYPLGDNPQAVGGK